MPCYSSTPTVLIDMSVIEKVTALLGIVITKHNANLITLTKGREYIKLQREDAKSKWAIVPYSGTGYFPTAILEPLGMAYAKEMVKKFAQKKGYTVSVGDKPGELVLTTYK
jgi:hypothetical protein